MTEPEIPKAEVDRVLAEFDSRQDLLASFCARTKGLIDASLQDAGIRTQSIQFRVKTKKKLREKYLDPAKDYKRLEDITDLAGLRIITYYEDEIDQVAAVIKREFDLDLQNSVDKRQVEPDKFGYSALNYVCKHLPKRTSDVEYKKYAGISCEIQITSVLRHAWSEIEHEWYDLKESYPEDVKRRFYRIAALLELAESEFLDIRKKRTDYQKSVAVRVEARVPDVAIDAVSLRAFIEQEALVASLDGRCANAMRSKLVADLPDSILDYRLRVVVRNGFAQLYQLRDALTKQELMIPEFVALCWAEVWSKDPRTGHTPTVNPGVSIYHLILFLSALQGKDAILSTIRTFSDTEIFWDMDAMASVARRVRMKYP